MSLANDDMWMVDGADQYAGYTCYEDIQKSIAIMVGAILVVVAIRVAIQAMITEIVIAVTCFIGSII